MKRLKFVTEEEIANFAFSAFLLSTAGWALLEAQLIKGNARSQAHLLACACGLLLSAVAFRRCRLWWPTVAVPRAAGDASGAWFGRREMVFCFVLVATVGVLSAVFRMGSIALLILCVGGIGVVPWAKISFCRRHFFLSWAILGVGTSASVLLSATGSHIPFPYLLSAWAMWIVASALMLITYRGADGPSLQPAQEIRGRQEQR
jgi:hypothetical protein